MTLVDIFNSQTATSVETAFINVVLESLQLVTKDNKKPYYKAVFKNSEGKVIIKTVFENQFSGSVVPICPVNVKLTLIGDSYTKDDTGEVIETTRVVEVQPDLSNLSEINKVRMAGGLVFKW